MKQCKSQKTDYFCKNKEEKTANNETTINNYLALWGAFLQRSATDITLLPANKTTKSKKGKKK